MSRIALIAPVVGVFAFVAVVALAGGQGGHGTAFERVASAPEQHAGQEVRVTGRVVERPARVPGALSGAFVLAGPQGRRLLVIPRPGRTLAPVVQGLRVAVRGRVVPLEPKADAQGPDMVATGGDVARRVDAVAFLRAVDVALRPR